MDPERRTSRCLARLTADRSSYRLDQAGSDYRLRSDAWCRNAGGALDAAVLPNHKVASEYVKHQGGQARPVDGVPDMGAYEAR